MLDPVCAVVLSPVVFRLLVAVHEYVLEIFDVNAKLTACPEQNCF